MRGIRTTKTKAFIALAALEMFFEDFDAEPMIEALVAMCEFATQHPDFDKDDNPGWDEYQWADQATDALVTLFLEECCVSDDGEGCPRFEFDPKTGCVIVNFPWARRRKRRRKKSADGSNLAPPRPPIADIPTASLAAPAEELISAVIYCTVCGNRTMRDPATGDDIEMSMRLTDRQYGGLVEDARGWQCVFCEGAMALRTIGLDDPA